MPADFQEMMGSFRKDDEQAMRRVFSGELPTELRVAFRGQLKSFFEVINATSPSKHEIQPVLGITGELSDETRRSVAQDVLRSGVAFDVARVSAQEVEVKDLEKSIPPLAMHLILENDGATLGIARSAENVARMIRLFLEEFNPERLRVNFPNLKFQDVKLAISFLKKDSQGAIDVPLDCRTPEEFIQAYLTILYFKTIPARIKVGEGRVQSQGTEREINYHKLSEIEELERIQTEDEEKNPEAVNAYVLYHPWFLEAVVSDGLDSALADIFKGKCLFISHFFRHLSWLKPKVQPEKEWT